VADGLFVAVEGIDRSGKTTLTSALATSIRELGFVVAQRAEPSGGTVGRLFREMSTAGNLSPISAALLSAADRHDQQAALTHDLKTAELILSDRYYLSGLAYHHADGIPTTFYRSLNNGIRRPDLYLYLDVDLDIARSRRGGQDGRWEAPSFAALVPAAYEVCAGQLEALEHVRLVRVDASRTAATVHRDALAAIVYALTERQPA
jgi:dTMP kinase